MRLVCALIVGAICVGFVTTNQVKRQSGDELIANYPFIVAITYDYNYAGNGVIVAGKWILSTATVFTNPPDNAYRAHAGSLNYLEGATVNSEQRVIKHPQYQPQNGPGNNIALAQMEQIFQETNSLQSVNLGINDVPYSIGTMASFGGSPYLQELGVKLASDEECTKNLQDEANIKIVQEGLAYCMTLDVEYPISAADLGAPIMSMNFLYGLYADGYVATRIAIYRSWILSTMSENP